MRIQDKKSAIGSIATNKEISFLRIGITGSPATGKKTVGMELARLAGLEFVSLNDLAIEEKCGREVDGEFIVDIQKLRSKKIETSGRVISGHLLHNIIPSSKLDFVAILRCSPQVLKKRYAVRGYSEQKIEENVCAELLDLISYETLKAYGREKVSEFDTTRFRNPESVARLILETVCGKRSRLYGRTRWSEKASKSPESFLNMAKSGS